MDIAAPTRRSIPQFLVAGASAVLLVVSVVGFLGRTDVDDGGGAGGTGPSPGAVAIAGFRFGPDAITVPAGSVVTWTNEDDFDHNVTSDDDGPLDSGDIAGGATFEATFDTAGTFAYTCTLHPNMEGTIEVTG